MSADLGRAAVHNACASPLRFCGYAAPLPRAFVDNGVGMGWSLPTNGRASMCHIDMCGKPTKYKDGLCSMHGARLARTGTTDARPRVLRAGPPSRQKPDYLSMAAHGHPLANTIGNVSVHRLVLWQKVGPSSRPCHWCGTEVHWFTTVGAEKMCADHVDDDRRNNSPNNLVPACNGCNTGRGRRPDYLTHCARGHIRTDANTRRRPDGARACRACERDAATAKRRSR